MAIRTIESRLERMSVNDENEPANGGNMYPKPKVGVCIQDIQTKETMLILY